MTVLWRSAKICQILNCCHPNALMTLKEYLEDYAGEETKKIGMELIDRELEKIPNPKVKQTAYEHIHDIAEGKRDFRFDSRKRCWDRAAAGSRIWM